MCDELGASVWNHAQLAAPFPCTPSGPIPMYGNSARDKEGLGTRLADGVSPVAYSLAFKLDGCMLQRLKSNARVTDGA